MSTMLPYRYPVDLTGVSPDNLVIEEPHAMVRRKVRCIAPMHAPVFKNSIQIFEPGSSTPLNSSQYKVLNLIPLPTAQAGLTKEVYAIIAITDESVGDNITINYQTVGGDYVQSYEAALDLLEDLSNDSRPTAWPNVIDRPPVYPASLHLHAVGDVVGWEYVAVALQQIREAVTMGDARGQEAVLGYLDSQTAALQALIATQSQPGQPLGQHIANQNNPHNVTKDQVGLGLVQNFPVATVAEAKAGTALNRYMTPSLVQEAIVNVQSVTIGNHPNNKDNPHQVNKDQVGLGNVPNYPAATISEGQAGSRSDRLMTPAATKAAIDTKIGQVGQVGAAHIADTTSNPHGVDKAQVGLSNVQNYATATVAQTITGTATNLYTTPAGVKGAMDAVKTVVQGQVSAHTGRTDNPHGVTKGQVGLGNVDNFATASDAETVAGTVANKFVTPKGMKAALQSVDLDVSTKVDADLVGEPNGVAPLNGDGVIDQNFLLNAPGNNVRDVPFQFLGDPTINSVIWRHVVTRAMSWEAAFAGSVAYAGTAPNANITLTLRRNTDTIGTISIANGQKNGVFTGAAGSAAVGDVIEVYYNGSGDTTLRDIIGNLLARAAI